MVDDRVVIMSTQGYNNLVKPENGKGLHWVCDINAELPVKIRQSGPGSERPTTIPQMFLNAVKSGGDRASMLVERDGKVLTWTWNQYYADSLAFAKAMAKIKVNERSSVAVMGFNSPEWAIAFMGGIMFNCVNTGIYSTNAPEACFYQAEHSEAEVIVVETVEMLTRFTKGPEKLNKVKAFVVYGDKALPAEIQDSRVFLWTDFLKSGNEIPNEVIMEKCIRQKPGECAVLIYTSGTTGKPKGCMLSHDNLTWLTIEVMEVTAKEKPDIIGPHNRTVSYLPLSHIAGLSFDLMNHLFNVHEQYFAKPDALQGSLVQTLQWARPTMFLAVPRVWEKFEEKLKEIAATKPAILQSLSGWAKGYGTLNTAAKMSKTDPPFMYSVANFIVLSNIKKALGLDQSQAFFFGAAPLKKSTIDYFASLDIVLFNVYGMSETTGAATINTFSNFKLDRCGMALPGVDVKIKNPDENGEGEILMRGRTMMMGYFKNESATIETIDKDGFVMSGDRGRIDPEGFLQITGRIKELIITAGGENIAPVPIEDHFKVLFNACSNIMVVGENQRFMAAFVTLKCEVDPKTGLPSKNLSSEAITYLKAETGQTFKTTEEAIADAKVNELVKKCIEQTNKKSVSRAAHIRKFKLLPVDFSIPGGELTPTLKLKRKVTETKYKQFVDEMFAADAKL